MKRRTFVNMGISGIIFGLFSGNLYTYWFGWHCLSLATFDYVLELLSLYRRK